MIASQVVARIAPFNMILPTYYEIFLFITYYEMFSIIFIQPVTQGFSSISEPYP